MRFLLPQPTLRLIFASMTAAHSANAISLSDFSPKITTTLSPACNAVYNQQITGCTALDFTSNSQCSSSCLQGLIQINSLVQSSCQNDDVSETSIIGLFQQGKGIQDLCNVAVVTTTTGGARPTTPASQSIGQSTMQLSSVVAPSNSIMTDTTMPIAPSISPSPPSQTSSMTTVPVGAPPPTSKSSTSASSKSSTSSSTKSSSSAQAENNGGNTQSGGGSPFDDTNNSLGAPAFTLSSATALLFIALGIILLLR